MSRPLLHQIGVWKVLSKHQTALLWFFFFFLLKVNTTAYISCLSFENQIVEWSSDIIILPTSSAFIKIKKKFKENKTLSPFKHFMEWDRKHTLLVLMKTLVSMRKRFRSLNKLIGPITFYCPRRMRNIMCQNKKEKLMKKIKHKKSEQNKISCVKQDTCTWQ